MPWSVLRRFGVKRGAFLPPSSYDPPPDASSTRRAAPTPLGALLRRRDPDRFFTALFAPPARREALFALYAFDGELAHARIATHDPTIALIRLAWWREVVEGAAQVHEVATPLAAALAAGLLDRAHLLDVIAAREAEATDAAPTFDAWRASLLGGAGGIMVAAGHLLGTPDPEALRPLGAACGVAALRRALARGGGAFLPAELSKARSPTPNGGMSPEGAPSKAGDLLAREGLRWLATARTGRLPRATIAAALPAVLARRDLRRVQPHTGGLGGQLAVMRAVVLGRV
ncbi:MAG: squalene/phytoene synthase family protein [Acetobacteraceae bacterium]